MSGGSGPSHAFSYAGHMTDLGVLGGSFSQANAMNSAGIIVGYSSTTDGFMRAFSYSAVDGMTDLGVLGGKYTNSTATCINSAGTIAGHSYASSLSDAHGFYCSGGAMNDIGTLGGSWSWAYGINSGGTIVGYSFLSGDAVGHAFSYTNGVMTDLAPWLANINLPGTSVAEAINDEGDIVGYGTTASGNQHAFVLAPLPILHVNPSGADLVFSWRTNAIFSFSLFQNTNLATTTWTTVTNAPTLPGDQKQVVIRGPLAGSRFYRLQSN